MGGKATWAFLGMEDQVPKVNGLGEALVRLKSDAGDAMEGFSQWVSHTAGAKVGADAFKEAVNNLDDSLSQLYGQNQDDAERFSSRLSVKRTPPLTHRAKLATAQKNT